ncbi:MAG: flagellar M-ring protein FliF [Xanthomonadaceae bacterium]|nr:flagellar M-ring protein FliF [Xanthomonadaceae bacterium]
MGDYLKKVVSQISDFFNTLSPARKVGVVITLILMTASIGGLFYWAGNKTYKPLMTNLNPEDATSIMRILRDKKIPFNVDPTGRNIEIPPEQIHNLRLELATIGLPQSSNIGYELFDKQQLGTTSFVQKVNQKRALEGELMRTINTIKGIKRSRVHLVQPDKSAFIEDQKKPSASVVLDVEPGTVLSEKQIYGIGNLVARAVEGLDYSEVGIVDSNGKTLSKNSQDPLVGITATQHDFKRKVEEEKEKQIEDMLARVVGEGRVVARVMADMDFSRVEENQTTYDADGSAVVSQSKNNDTAEGTRPGPIGAPGATTNQPGNPPMAAASTQIRNNTNKNNELTNYAVPQTTRRTIKQPGGVTKWSVAVVLDGKTVKTTDKDGKVLAKVESWAPEKLKEFEALVASAVGFDAKRGDKIEVKNMEFTREDFEEAQRTIAESERRGYIQNLIIYGVIGILILLFFVFVVRPFIKWVTENTIDSVDLFLPQTLEELESLQKGAGMPQLEDTVPALSEKIAPEKIEGEMIKEKIISLVDNNPQKAALVLRDWIKGQPAKEPAKEVGKGKSA